MTPRALTLSLLIAIAATTLGCESQTEERGESKVTILFSLSDQATFFERPFPIDFERDPDGTIALWKFPNPKHKPIIQRYIDSAESLESFGLNAGAFFPATDLIDESSLPTLAGSLNDSASAFIVNIDPASDRFGERVPILCYVRERGGDFTKRGLITLLPMPGYPLEPNALYAAVLTDGVKDRDGLVPKPHSDFIALRDGEARSDPTFIQARATFEPLWNHLERIGFSKERLLCATAFRTQDPWREMSAIRDYVYSHPPTYVPGSLRLVEDYPDFCFLEGRFEIPIFQRGAPPYLFEGGWIEFDAAGVPIVDHYEQLRFSLAIPKTRMPGDGFPLLIHSHGSGGDYRTLIDRGARGSPEGHGLAWYLANIGIASASMDAPHHGERDPFIIKDADLESLFFFNALNPPAMRDNIRQAAAEQMMLELMLANLEVEPELCPGVDASASPDGNVFFNSDLFLFHGHSQGAVVAGPFLGTDTICRAALLTGAGAHMMLTMLDKKSPTDTLKLLKFAAGLPPTEDELNEFSPLLSLAQMLSEAADPATFAQTYFQAFAPLTTPKHIFQVVGIDDTYVPLETEYAAALSATLSPAGELLDDSWQERFDLLELDVLDYPVLLNRPASDGSLVTAAFAEYASDGSFDGHFVFYELPEPKHQALCFFKTLIVAGVPTIVEPQPDPFAPCEP